MMKKLGKKSGERPLTNIKMIDIHCHFLPGIDDGLKTLDESIQALKKAEQEGVTDIVLTPHYMKGTIYNADNVRKWKLFQELRQRAASEGIQVQLYLGNEIYIDEQLPKMLGGYVAENDDADEDRETMKSSEKIVASAKICDEQIIYQVSTLNSGKYVLVELPVQNKERRAQETLFRLVRKGFIPVIAHPERYFYVQQDLRYVDEFLSMGCVFQGDYLALDGKYGKAAEKALRKLLVQGKIFCLASDMHKVGEYKLEKTHKKLLKLLKKADKVEALLYDNPKKVLVSSL